MLLNIDPNTMTTGKGCSERLRRVFVLWTVEEIQWLGGCIIEPQHLLLGLMRETDCAAIRLLERKNVNLIEVRQTILSRLTPVEQNHDGEMYLSEASRTLIRKMFEEGDKREAGRLYITEHLLLALASEVGGLASEALAQVGMTYDVISRILTSKPERVCA